jgi:phenylalanyl-tRNA synthetase beta chain
VRIVYPWLCELVHVPGDAEAVAHEIALRGFEVAGVEHGRQPVIDFEVTANRPDCLSHLGIAREASCIWNLPVALPDVVMPASGPAEPLDVRIDAPDLCPRYCAQVFEVTVGPSPGWLVERLEAAGVRAINNIVDVTNYVLLEMGQPMHAFDLSRLRERTIVVRQARPGETLRTLDGVDRALTPEMLVIADATTASALGGIMGGAESEIGSATTRVALESAYFQPASVRRTSRRLGLKTEASTRFERGGDVNAPPVGIARAAALLARLGAGRPLGSMIDRYPVPVQPARVTLRASRIARVLGLEVPESEIPRILTPLGFAVAPAADRTWTVGVPSFRVDVSREIDLIEEVGRHHGFDKLPATFPALARAQAAPDAQLERDRAVRRLLLAAGFSEAMTFAFIEREAALPFCEPGVEPAAIANPLSEKFAVLRPSLLPGLLDAYAHNRRRERRDVRLFETGARFPAGGETRAAALLWAGAADGPHWSAPPRAVDFFDVKGVVDALATMVGATLEVTPAAQPFLAAGRAAEAASVVGGVRRVIAVLGQLAPAVAAARGVPEQDAIYVAEIDLGLLGRAAAGESLRAETLPRFPSIVRDLSMLFDDTLPAATVRGTIRSAAPDTLVSITEFDRYHGTGVPEGKISLSLRLLFRAPDRTLTDDEAQAAMDGIVEALRAAHGGERR